jgi:hypothetical protein
MKVCILGINGYIGSSIARYMRHSSHTVIGTSRNEIDFDRPNAPEKLENYLDYEKPDFVVNGIGTIDSCADSPIKIFNAIFLPNYLMFQYYKEKLIENDTYIWSLGSNSAGKPRREFPIYAALKGAEFALLQTVWEKFDKSKLKWFYSTFPRLSGGLGNVSNKNVSENDYQLICIEIDKIFDKTRIK